MFHQMFWTPEENIVCSGIIDRKSQFLQRFLHPAPFCRNQFPCLFYIRLFLQSRGDAVGFSSVLPALEKRYRPTGKPGEFEAGEAPARNVWPAVIRFTPYRKAAGGTVEEGTLEFFAGIDGVKKEEAVWDALLEEKKAREAQARQVDSLFE